MTRDEMFRASFVDELQKIAGELQGFTRSGRRPLGVSRLLEREGESNVGPSDIFGGEVKLSQVPYKALGTLGTLAAGAGLYHLGMKANQDRKMGRAMRIQQGAGY